MKVKFFYLLSFLAIGAAAALTNCAKETQTLAPSAENPVPATQRGGCDITIETNGNLEICGTQTNAITCLGTFGLENLGLNGTATYTLTTSSFIHLTNVANSNPSDCIQIKIGPSGQLGAVHYINDGATQTFFVDDQCVVN